MSVFDFNTEQTYNLAPTSLFIRSKEQLRFELFDSVGEPIDITQFTTIWTLSELGQADITLLTKVAINSGYNGALVVIDVNDTKGFKGTKYIQQLTLVDYKGSEKVVARGTIKFNGNNKN